MSIAENVGAIASILSRGDAGRFFEEFGLDYVGPVDGHRLELLLGTLEGIRRGDYRRPVLLHVKTQKGRGYAPAEDRPADYHGVAPLSVKKAAPPGSPAALPAVAFSRAFGEALCRLAREDERVVAITAAMPEGTGLSGFAREFPERFFDVGIAEAHAVTFAAGLAARGHRPVVAIYSTFFQRAIDQLIHDVCLQGLPVVFALDRAGLVGADGPTHHGAFDLALLLGVPGLAVVSPSSPEDLAGLLAAGVSGSRPFAIRFPRGEGKHAAWRAPVSENFGAPRGFEIAREAAELSAVVVALGPSVDRALEAAQLIDPAAQSVSVVAVSQAKPLPDGLVNWLDARKGPVIMTLEDGTSISGFGSLLASRLAPRSQSVEVLGYPDRFIEHGAVAELEAEAGVSVAALVERLRSFVGRPPVARGERPLATVKEVSAPAQGDARKPNRARLDQLVVERGLATSRTRAQALILAGNVLVDDVPVTKAGQAVNAGASLRLRGEDHPFVSRGGLKLDRALEAFGISVTDRSGLDVGASTGGFTQVLLTRGAARVHAVDVGRSQMDWALRTDPRVRLLDGTNARYLEFDRIGERVGVIVVDVSFISLEKILPALLQFADPSTDWVTLIKPQFEVGRERVGKGGIVVSEEARAEAVERVRAFGEGLGLVRLGLIESPIKGSQGNIEYLAHWRVSSRSGPSTGAS
jgi:TlyA family rRNA methyltransferase/putative hemolysin